MVLTLPARGSFRIIARYTSLGGGVSFPTAGWGAGGPHMRGVSHLPRGNRLFYCCCFREMMLLKWNDGSVAALAIAL